MSEFQGNFQSGLCSCLRVEVEGSQRWLSTTLESKSVVEREGLGVFLFGFSFAVQYQRCHLGFLFFLILGRGTKLGSVVRCGSHKPCRKQSQCAVLLRVSSKDPKWPPCCQHTQLWETAKFMWEGSGMWNNGCDLEASVFVLEVKKTSVIFALFFFD